MNEVEDIDTAAEFIPSEYKKMFDKATLVAVERNWSQHILKEAFLYYEGIGSITPSSMTDINALIAAGNDSNLWSQLKQQINADCDELVSNAVSIAYTLNNPAPGLGGPGGGGGAGGSASTDKPTDPDKGTEINPSGNQVPAAPTFRDLTQAEWAREAVEYLAKSGVISGKSAYVFAPNDNVKREEGAKIITGAFGIVDDGASCDFSDVEQDRWSYKYIASAVRLGIIKGDGAEYRPAAAMTREEMATILYRMFKLLDIEIAGDAMSFTDNGQISSWAKEAVSALSGAGVINGMGDGTFAPKALVTRAQLAKVTYEIMKLVGGV